MKIKVISLLLLPLLFFSCAGTKPATDSYQSFKAEKGSNLGIIYDKAAQYEGLKRNPVIVIPGFLGSRLIDSETKKVVWGNFTLTPILSIAKEAEKLLTASELPINIKKASLLALPMYEGDQIQPVVPDGVLEKVDISYVGLSINVGAYSYIVDALGAGKYRHEPKDKKKEVDYGANHHTSFEFGYDWRQDLTHTVKQLHQFILEKRAYLQKEYEKKYGEKDHDIKFDVVAHSMAGLLTRYYLRYGTQDLPEDGSLPRLTWEGAKNIDELIIVATPNGGYLDTFKELVTGLELAPLPKFKYVPGIIGTWATYYMMLPAPGGNPWLVDEKNPEGPGLDVFDPELWIKMGWGLVDPKQDAVLKFLLPDIKTAEKRRAIAINLLKSRLARAKQFIQAMQVKAAPPEGTTLHLFTGDAVATNSKIGVNLENGKIKVLETAPGDGVVLRSSALYDLRTKDNWEPGLVSPIHWHSATFLPVAHMGVTKDPVFLDNVLFLLLDEPRS